MHSGCLLYCIVILGQHFTNFTHQYFLYVRRMLSAMANRSDLHSQLTTIVQTMAKSVLSQVCKVVDEDSVQLRLELSRLLVVNSTLADKVNSLERELGRKTNQPQFRQLRSIGVQTVSTTDGDACGMSSKSSSQMI